MSARKAGRHGADLAIDNRQLVWTALRKGHDDGRDWLTLDAIVAETGVMRKTATDYLRALVAGGYAEEQEHEKGTIGAFRMTRDGGVHAPRIRKDGSPVTQGAATLNLWRSMRGLRKFSVIDLVAHSNTPAVEVSEATAQTYCSMLLATGYLRVVQKAAPVYGRKAIYRLIRDDGPKPPMIQRVKQVFDPNTGKVYRKEGM